MRKDEWIFFIPLAYWDIIAQSAARAFARSISSRRVDSSGVGFQSARGVIGESLWPDAGRGSTGAAAKKYGVDRAVTMDRCSNRA